MYIENAVLTIIKTQAKTISANIIIKNRLMFIPFLLLLYLTDIIFNFPFYELQQRSPGSIN